MQLKFYVMLLLLRSVVLFVLCFGLLQGYWCAVMLCMIMLSYSVVMCRFLIPVWDLVDLADLADLALLINLFPPSRSLVHCNTKCNRNVNIKKKRRRKEKKKRPDAYNM